jgi:eukaryotic-like serine/threonine-protein kinase
MDEIEYNDVISQYDDPELIHHGGQRIVFTVIHPDYGKVILKIGNYKAPDSRNGWDIERIIRETELLKQIDSIYYPKNFNFEQISGSRYVIIEEFIESTTLDKCIDRFQNSNEIINLIKHLTIGLNVIWKKGIVHRDINPNNILITPNGLPKIIDLGIARYLDRKSITRTIFGGPLTQEYAAPEQLHYNKKLIDPRTDQFNLGIILVQLLLKGKHPFDPRLVEGISIPDNILNDNWYKQVLDDESMSPIRSIATKLLGHHQYQRFRTPEMLIREIESCSRCEYEV